MASPYGHTFGEGFSPERRLSVPAIDMLEQNVATVRRGFQAFTDRDMATLSELFHPDAKWHSAPTGVLGGDRHVDVQPGGILLNGGALPRIG